MAWVYLFLAGGLEVFWATFLKLSEGFTRMGYSALTVAGMLASFGLLSQAMKTLPLGTAYAVWTGIGALGSLIVGIAVFREPATVPRLLFAARGHRGLEGNGGLTGYSKRKSINIF